MSALPVTLIVGTGPVGISLAGAFRNCKVPILGIWGRTRTQVLKAGKVAKVCAITQREQLLYALARAEVIVVAVSDYAIEEVALELWETGQLKNSVTLLHCAGSMSAESAFGKLLTKVGGVGLMHPLCALVDGEAGIARLSHAVFGVQGVGRGLVVAKQLCQALGATEIVLDETQVSAYHAAAVTASNYVVTLMNVSRQILESSGISTANTQRAFVELAKGALENVTKQGMTQALSGPIRRGDVKTIQKHVDVLSQRSPEELELYECLGAKTVLISKRCGDASDKELDAINTILNRNVANS